MNLFKFYIYLIKDKSHYVITPVMRTYDTKRAKKFASREEADRYIQRYFTNRRYKMEIEQFYINEKPENIFRPDFC